MKHLFLINPAAGKKDSTDRFTRQIRRVCRDLNYEIRISRKPGDITNWTRQAARSGRDLRVYACGGDGTLNEVVNGAAGFPNVAVTHFPGGSGNDFIRMFGDAAPFFDLDKLVYASAEEAMDLIECNGEYALNICTMGLDARIGTEMARYKRLPLVTGSGAYILSTLVNAIKGVHKPYHIEIDGEVIDGRETMIFVGNGQWYGGGFRPVPEADPTSGVLEVLLVKPVSRLTVLRVMGPYKQGKYKSCPQYIRHIRARSLRITCPGQEPVNLDGEARRVKQADIRVAPHKLRFFYPACLSDKRIWRKTEQTGAIGR